jgi:hypothetical protein
MPCARTEPPDETKVKGNVQGDLKQEEGTELLRKQLPPPCARSLLKMLQINTPPVPYVQKVFKIPPDKRGIHQCRCNNKKPPHHGHYERSLQLGAKTPLEFWQCELDGPSVCHRISNRFHCLMLTSVCHIPEYRFVQARGILKNDLDKVQYVTLVMRQGLYANHP